MKINKEQLRDLILDGISSEELNSKYDYSHITNMSWMFDGCSSLKSIPELDTSNVTDMIGFFYGCSKLETIPDLDTSNVTDMYRMFSGCYNLKDLNPYNFHLYYFFNLDNKYIKEKYPEFYV